MSYLDNLDPAPTDYTVPPWITAEARRIRRERRVALIESVLLGICIGAALGLIVIVLGWV